MPVRLFSLLCLLWLSSADAFAHAVVTGSTPAANAKISGENLAIEIRFNSRIDGARSSLKLYGSDGGAILIEGVEAAEDALKGNVRKLAPGAYRLHWQALSPDGHISQGDIPFAVGP